MAANSAWPELKVEDREPTRDTLTLWLQDGGDGEQPGDAGGGVGAERGQADLGCSRPSPVARPNTSIEGLPEAMARLQHLMPALSALRTPTTPDLNSAVFSNGAGRDISSSAPTV